MRAVIQRVVSAGLTVDNRETVAMGDGLVVLLGIEEVDDRNDIEWLVHKIIAMRIFGDDEGKMNLSVQDINGEILVVSQFTLHASTRKGNRPSFIKAARPEQAIPLYEMFLSSLNKAAGVPVHSGVFGAEMKITLINDGPVTIIIDTKSRE